MDRQIPELSPQDAVYGRQPRFTARLPAQSVCKLLSRTPFMRFGRVRSAQKFPIQVRLT
ncbi:hypothetical protein RPMA_00790 [Tardiphaga alba]|uniref:Uncharacterized protein n=1 Tax=Tardiphaga alba TaxID=340268 RepID=A0ABX8A5M8_9BRAD|nr:hypothetical protein RPMA_00790 [Tardiphaga alba]